MARQGIASGRHARCRTRLRDPAARYARVLHGPAAQRGRGECRVPSAPAASCALGVVQDAHEYSQRSHRKSPGIPARSGFNGFLRALPGDRAFLSPSPLRSLLPKNLTPASRRQDHTTSPSATSALSSLAPRASTASRPNVRDDGQRPSPGTGWPGYESDLDRVRTEIFLQRELDRPLAKQPPDLPVGLIVSPVKCRRPVLAQSGL